MLTANLLTTLRSILSSYSALNNDPHEPISLQPYDLLQLGLDPITDGWFVEELSRIYFGKEVDVVGKERNDFFDSCLSVCSVFEGMCCCFGSSV